MSFRRTEAEAAPPLREIARLAQGGALLLVGVGNRMFGDDGVGPMLIEQLAGRTNAELLDAGDSPEAYLGAIESSNAETVVLVDAVDFGQEPGAAAVFTRGRLPKQTSGTHRIPLGMLMDYISRLKRADIYLLGIQPESSRFGTQVGENVRRSVAGLADLLSSGGETSLGSEW